ncbi:MAG TPA: DUF4340 domain-containing protein [Kofleriaceae bacterium]|nr:DUF4340 domain-containing protein [Kofleriaceae bacterium]
MTPPPPARLVTLTAIVVALAAAVGITSGGSAVVERPLIAPGLTANDVTRVTLTRAGSPPIVVAIDDTGTRVEAPVPGPADEATVRDLISALASARADRVVSGASATRVAGLDASTLRVRVEGTGQAALDVVRGAAVPASGQVWLGVGDRALLVPAWVGAALDRDLASLRRRQVFPAVSITGVEIHGRGVDLVLSGSPLRRRDEGAGVRVARAAVAQLDAALAKVVLDVFVAGDLVAPDFTVRVLGGAEPHELAVHGACPGHPTHLLVGGSAGVGCVRTAVVDDVVSAAATLASASGIERVLAPGAGADIESITSGDVTLARRGAGWLLTLGTERVDADDDAVAAFLAALAVEAMPGPLPTGAPAATWTVTLLGGSVETWRWYVRGGDATPLVRRDDEPSALIVAQPTGDARHRLGPSLRNLTLLVIDASTVNAIRATGASAATLVRGQLVGDWTVQSPAGTTATSAATELVATLATFRASRWLEPRDLGATRRTLVFSIDAPPIPDGAPSTHTITIGAARANNGCAARIDAFLPVELPAALCAALLAPLAR